MSALHSAVDHVVAVRAGWVALLALSGTSTVALLLAMWRALHPGDGPDRQHRAALLALVACVLTLAASLLGVGTKATSRSVSALSPVRSEAPTPSPTPSTTIREGARPTSLQWVSRVAVNRAAGIAGSLWMAGVGVLLIRFIGGWALAQGVRRRAVPVDDEDLRDVLCRVQRHFGIASAVALKRSSEIEAPVVLGARQSTLLLPHDLTNQFSTDAVTPLLAHECAHIARRDYVTNLVQSAVDAVLFFSPAVLWISRRIRESREFCCDDAAVLYCAADRGHYVRVLTTLASLGTVTRGRALVASTGPRLITRVRRLLSEDTMPRPSMLKVGVAATATVVVLLVTPTLAQLSASHLAALPAATQDQTVSGPFPIGFVPQQPGSSVVLGVTSSEDYLADTITVRNLANVAVASVVLVAVVEGGEPLHLIALSKSEPILVTVGPGQTTMTKAGFLSPDTLHAMADSGGVPPRQVFFGLTHVAYANASEWSMTPNAAGRTHDEVLNLPPYSILRSLIAAHPGTTDKGRCVDDRGLQTSHGGVVAVTNEPGRFAVCANGAWIDHGPATGQGEGKANDDAGYALDLTLQQPNAPVALRGYTATAATFLYESARVENASSRPVTSVTLGVMVADTGDPARGRVVLQTSPVPVSLQPRMTQTVPVNLLRPAELERITNTYKGRPKITLGLLEVRLADGSRWSYEPPPDAVTF